MKKNSLWLIAGIVVVAMPQIASAATGGGALPWETPLQTIQASLTGPVATSIALIAIAVAGAMLIFGGEINNFARMGVYITLVLGMLVMANNMLSSLYTTSATIPEHFQNPPTVEHVNNGQ